MINISATLQNQPFYLQRVAPIVQAALDAADPEKCVRAYLNFDRGTLRAGDKKYNLESYKRVFLIGAGKAAFSMAKAAAAIFHGRITEGALIVKHLPEEDAAFGKTGIKVLKGDHPVPGFHSLISTEEILRIVRQAGKEDLVVFLLSGGASSLFTCPHEGISLEDMQALTGRLLACGADIGEINTLRKHLDAVKGGGLVRMAAPADLLVLVLSDVVGNPLSVIGSGPAAGDTSTFAEALDILQKYHLMDVIPKNILKVLRDGLEGRIPETVRPVDAFMKSVHQIIIGSVDQSARAAWQAAVDGGFDAKIITTSMTGEARDRGREYGKLLADTAVMEKTPFCLIAGGETTVTIRGKGVGGRNLELALAAVEPLAGVPDAALISVATDGDDGVSGAAGALITGGTLAQALVKGIHPGEYLENNDSFHFFENTGGLLVTGPTGTNVNDLVFLLGGLGDIS
jgi:hydroxypyruvate reductase